MRLDVFKRRKAKLLRFLHAMHRCWQCLNLLLLLLLVAFTGLDRMLKWCLDTSDAMAPSLQTMRRFRLMNLLRATKIQLVFRASRVNRLCSQADQIGSSLYIGNN